MCREEVMGDGREIERERKHQITTLHPPVGNARRLIPELGK
jgi:hypothetical protein